MENIGTIIVGVLGFGYLVWMGSTLSFLAVRGVVRGYKKGMAKEFLGEVWKLTDHWVEIFIGFMVLLCIMELVSAFLGKSL